MAEIIEMVTNVSHGLQKPLLDVVEEDEVVVVEVAAVVVVA